MKVQSPRLVIISAVFASAAFAFGTISVQSLAQNTENEQGTADSSKVTVSTVVNQQETS